MKRLLFLVSFFYFLQSNSSENDYVLLQWKNPKETFYFWLDKKTNGDCYIIDRATSFSEYKKKELIQLLPVHIVFEPSKVIDCSGIKEGNTIWDRQTLQNSFDFLKDPLKIAEDASINELQRIEKCIDYLSPNKSCMKKVQTTILEGLGVDEAKAELILNKLKKYLIQSVQDLNDKKTEIEIRKDHSKKILISHYQNSVLKKGDFHIFTDFSCTNYRTLAFRFTAKGHFLNISSLYENINKIISANAKELDISSGRAVRISRLSFGPGFPIIIIDKMPESKKTEYDFTQAKDIKYIDASGLKGDEEANFIFSKDLSDEVKEQIIEEIEQSNNKLSIRFYRAVKNYNPINMLCYALKGITNKMVDNENKLILGSFIVGAIGLGLAVYYLEKNSRAEKTIAALYEFNQVISEVKDELLKKKALVSGLANTVAEPMLNEFKKYVLLSQWQSFLLSSKLNVFSSSTIELLKNNHFDQLIPIDPTTKSICVELDPFDRFFTFCIAPLTGGIIGMFGLGFSVIILAKIGNQYRYIEKNKVKFK